MNQPSSVREDPQSVPQVLTSDSADNLGAAGQGTIQRRYEDGCLPISRANVEAAEAGNLNADGMREAVCLDPARA